MFPPKINTLKYHPHGNMCKEFIYIEVEDDSQRAVQQGTGEMGKNISENLVAPEAQNVWGKNGKE